MGAASTRGIAPGRMPGERRLPEEKLPMVTPPYPRRAALIALVSGLLLLGAACAPAPAAAPAKATAAPAASGATGSASAAPAASAPTAPQTGGAATAGAPA